MSEYVTTSMSGWTLDELAVLEAAKRGLSKAYHGRRFDPVVFQAVAEAELVGLRRAVSHGCASGDQQGDGSGAAQGVRRE